MKCPVCSKNMIAQDLGGVNIDVCQNGCKGLWFDWNELKKLDETNEGFGQALKAALDFPRSNSNDRAPIQCPKCNITMHAHQFEADKEINVDECYGCGGFFLDSGELKHIRDNHMSEQERDIYVAKLLEDVPAYQQGLRDMNKDDLRMNALQRFSNALRVSYFLKD